MANLKVPTYERQVENIQQKTATAQAPAPVRQAFGENVIGGIGNLGQALNQLGNDFIKIQANNDKNLLLLKTNELENDYKTFRANLQTKSDYQNFDNYKKEFIDKQINKLKTDLGDNLFNKWWNVEGNRTFNTISADIDIMKIPAGIKQDNQLLKDNISTLAYQYATTPNEQAIIFNKSEIQIDNSIQNDDVKQALKKDRNRQFAKSEIDFNINVNPQQVKNNILNKKYEGALTAKEEGYYLNKCDTLIKNREGTIYDNKIESTLAEFEAKYSQSVSLANEFLEEEIRKKNGLVTRGVTDTKLINKAISYMEKRINESGDFKQSSIILEQQIQLAKNELVSKDKELAKNGDYTPIEDYISFIDNCDNALNSRYLTNSDYNKVLKNRNYIYDKMGSSIKQEEFNPTADTSSGWFKSTNSGYLRNQLNKIFTESGMLEDGDFKDISNKEVGIIYSQAYKYCNGMNMGETKTEDSELKIQEAVSKSLIKFVSVKYGVQAKDSAEILIGKHLIKLRNDVKKQTEGFTLNSYKD